MVDSINLQTLEEFFEQLLMAMDPATAQYFEQLLAETVPSAGPLCKAVQNIMFEHIPLEEQECLVKALLPPHFQPKAPPQKRKEMAKKKILEEFDSFPVNKPRKAMEYQKLLRWLDRDPEVEGRMRMQER